MSVTFIPYLTAKGCLSVVVVNIMIDGSVFRCQVSCVGTIPQIKT